MRYFFFITFLFYSSSIFSIDTKANEAIVIDYNTNEVLFEKNSDSKISPASLTKIMTAYIVFDRINNSSLTSLIIALSGVSAFFTFPPGNSQKLDNFLFFGLNDINTFPCQSINATMETYIFFFFN